MIDAYKIGVTIAMTNGVSGVLGTIAKDVLGLHGHIKETEAAFGRMRMAIVGAAGVLGSVAVLGVLKALTKEAMAFRTEQVKLSGAGFTPQQRADATSQAWNVATSTPGANLEHTMAHMRELKEILGTAEAATAASPTMEKLAVALSAQTGMDKDSALRSLAKAAEMQAQEHLFDKDGKFNAATFAAKMDDAYKFLVAANGFVKPEQMVSMMQQAGVSGQLAQSGTFWRDMLMMAIEQGGARAGTGLAADFRTILGGVQGKNRQDEWVKAGLSHYEGAGKDRHAVLNKDGEGILTDPKGGVPAWFEQKMLPAILKMGHFNDLKDQGAAEYVRSWIQKNESVETARRSLSVLTNQVGLRKAQENYDTTPGFEAAFNQHQAENPELKMKAFSEAWHNLTVALGMPMVDTATGMMGRLTVKLNEFALWASQHPDSVANIEKVVAAFAVLIGVGGAMTIAGMALGPFVVGIKGLVGVLASGEVAKGTAAATTLGGAGAGSLLLLAGGITAFGVAVASVIGILTSANPSNQLSTVGGNINRSLGDANDWFRSTFGGETADQALGRHTAAAQEITKKDNAFLRDFMSGAAGEMRPSANGEPPRFRSNNAMPAPDWSQLTDFLKQRGQTLGSDGKPIPVTITNPGAVAAATARDMSGRLAGPSTGASGADSRVSAPPPGGHPQ